MKNNTNIFGGGYRQFGIKKVILAFTVAFIFANLLLFPYERPVVWIDTPNGSSRAIREPNSILVHGTEGYGISQIDENGFLNASSNLSDDYILVMGSSHTQGKEVTYSNRYTSIVDNYYSNNRDVCSAYNISCDGHYLPSIIKHFDAAVYDYADTKCIVIEIGSTDFSVTELEDAALQIENIDMRSATELFSQQSTKARLKNIIKDYFPLISMMKSQFQTAKAKVSTSFESIDTAHYYDALSLCLSLIRSEYTGPIVFVYHPNTQLSGDGTLEIVRSETIDIFQQVCEDTGIDFIDVGDAFYEHYQETYELPYGFANTTPGNGHLNSTGHKIMAEAIINYLKEENIK